MSRRDVVVHSLDHAVAALEAARDRGVPIRLVSAPGAAATIGAAAFRAMIADAERLARGSAEATVLDCADAPGLALNALRNGARCLRIDLPAELRAKIADIAAQYGATLDDERGPSFDLGAADDPRTACQTWLATPLLDEAGR